ncbi:hypothetical protein GWA97_05255, partial [Flavobacterium sp. LaA7.5]|nr:hypothetical protein [Flavobacterium salilacus subsp. altitudinum]
MKNLLYILLLFPVLVFAQTQEQNYVKSMTYHTATTATDTAKARTNITYFDGLGRPIQQIAAKASGDEKNIITHIEYDEFGRQVMQYLPYASANSGFEYEQDALPKTQDFYDTPKYEYTTNPYSLTFFEGSPLNRTTKQAAPGVAWQGVEDTDNNVDNDADHTVKFKYELNKAYEVRRFEVNFETTNGIEDTEKTLLSYKNHYYANELYKTITKDENWIPADGKNKTTEEFKDKLGRIILKRTYSDSQPHDTYYVYDRFSNLTYVIPPLAADAIVEATSTLLVPGVNFGWTVLSQVDQQLAEDYGRYLQDYDNSEILNLDLIDRYGGQGGFSVTPQQNGTLTLSINIATASPMPYRTGAVLDLRAYGTFQDTDLGRVSGTGYDYIFSVRDSWLYVEGAGNVPSVNTTFNSAQQLSYSRNYPWTAFCKADSEIAQKYEQDIAGLDNSEILTTYTPNDYGAMGGIAVSVSEDDIVTLSINLSSTTPLELIQGNVIQLPLQRSLPDTEFGVLNGNGYNYNISIRDNNVLISNGNGGAVTNLNYYNSLQNKVTHKVVLSTLYGLCYIYHYDSRNRVVEKHIPGAGWTHIVYDKLDRPVLTQDENQRLKDDWTVTKYDVLGRTLYTGIYNKPGITRLSLQGDVNNADTPAALYETTTAPSAVEGVTFGYTQSVFPTPLKNLLTVNYYDNYSFDLAGITLPTTATIPQISTVTLGLPTGSKVRVMEGDDLGNGSTTAQWITQVSAYDAKGRQLWNSSTNPYLQTQDVTRTYFDFIGQVTGTDITHSRAGFPDLKVYNSFWLDAMGRPVKHAQSQTPQGGWQIGPFKHIIAENRYDELGQLAQKGVGGKDGIYDNLRLQTIDYTYNIRGWLKEINNPDEALSNDLFAFKINYNEQEHANATGLYNGNISETYWRSKTDNKKRGYYYHYDGINRIAEAKYINVGNYTLADYPTEIEDYTTQNILYDKNGNLIRLHRTGLTAANTIDRTDMLNYTYLPNSNRLKAVADEADGVKGFRDDTHNNTMDYDYDLNGNMTKDLNKGIGTENTKGIDYNHLNLPVKVLFSGSQNGIIRYVYDATGAKLQKIVDNNGNIIVTDYANGFIYENNILKSFSHPEGYARVPSVVNEEYNPDDFEYIYQYKDHLGNVRLSYSDADNSGAINDVNPYLVEEGFENSGWTGLTGYAQ